MSSILGTKPLSSVYGAVTGSEIDEESAQKMAKSGASAAYEYATKEVLILRKYVEEGDWTWRLAGMACGCLMIMTGIFGTLSSVFSLNPFTAVLDLYILCFGIISVCLEYKDQVMVKRNVDIIRREFHFITTPWGRAAFYFFSGILMVASGGILEIISGLFLMIVGAVIYYSCHNAYAALNKLHDAKYSEAMLLEKFKEFDLDKDDHLNTKEFSELCASLGVTLNRFELETALFVLDKDASGLIDKTEFVSWFRDNGTSLINN